MPRRVFIIVAMSVTIVAGAIVYATHRTTTDAHHMAHGPAIGTPAHAIDLATISEARFTLADVNAAPTIITFGASWCEPCRREYPLIEVARQRNPALRVVGILERDSPSIMATFMNKVGAHWPVLNDANGAVAARYAVNEMPDTYFLDRNHIIAAHVVGEMDQTTLDANLRVILAPLR